MTPRIRGQMRNNGLLKLKCLPGALENHGSRYSKHSVLTIKIDSRTAERNINKAGTSKVGAISKAQKALRTFLNEKVSVSKHRFYL